MTFFIGKIIFPNRTESSAIPYLTRQLVSWTLLILIVLISITMLTIIFLLVIIVRRYYCHSWTNGLHRKTEPPQFYQDVWCELGKKWQINPKNLSVGEKIGQGCFGDVYRGELKQHNNQMLQVAVKVLRGLIFLCKKKTIKKSENLTKFFRSKRFGHA